MGKIIIFILALSFAHADSVIEEEVPVIVLGGGVGAMTSALYLARSGIPPVVIAGPIPGGTILMSSSVQNWPG